MPAGRVTARPLTLSAKHYVLRGLDKNHPAPPTAKEGKMHIQTAVNLCPLSPGAGPRASARSGGPAGPCTSAFDTYGPPPRA